MLGDNSNKRKIVGPCNLLVVILFNIYFYNDVVSLLLKTPGLKTIKPSIVFVIV